jgi:hypothetical protein
MRAVTLVAIAALWGCGGSSKPGPKGPGAGKTDPKVAVVKPSCTTVAALVVKEHGFGKIPAAAQERAKNAGEAEVAAACLDDQWPDTALECMATRASPSSCIGQLDEYQQHSYDAHFGDWELNWTKGPGSRGHGGGGGGEDDPPPPDDDDHAGSGKHEEWISCETSLGDVASYEPAIRAGADKDYAVKVRRAALARTCELKWSNDDKKCFAATKDAAGVAACRAKLDQGGKNSLANSLVDADVRMKKTLKLSKDKRVTDCKALAVAYYNDDNTSGRLTSLAPAERDRVIKQSRDALAKSCKDDKWKPTERACVAQAKNEYSLADCFDESYGKAFRFRLPAAGVTFKVGIPECDELGDVIKKIGTCEKIEKDIRDMLMDSYSTQLGMWVETRASEKAEVAALCKENVQRYTDGAKERGCAM